MSIPRLLYTNLVMCFFFLLRLILYKFPWIEDIRHINVNSFYFIFRWYFRKIKRIEAEKKLLLPENEHGAFLIRDSESRHNDYSLSGIYIIFKCTWLNINCVFIYLQFEMVIQLNIIEFVNWMKGVFSLPGVQHSEHYRNWSNIIPKIQMVSVLIYVNHAYR